MTDIENSQMDDSDSLQNGWRQIVRDGAAMSNINMMNLAKKVLFFEDVHSFMFHTMLMH